MTRFSHANTAVVMPAQAGICFIAQVLIKSLLLSLLISFPAYACNIYDDMGHSIHLPRPATRIISLAPDITEILFAIGAGNQIVGVVSSSDYPEGAKKIKVIGSATDLDIELILSLHPDLIINWNGNFSRQLSAIKQFGIPVYDNNPQHLEDIANAMKKFGCLTGKQKEANQKATEFEALLAALRQDYHHEKPVRVFYQLGEHSLMTINKNSWINQVIALCGGRNVFADAKVTTPEVDMESVIAADPQVIIAAATNDDWKRYWESYKTISAVKNKRLVTVNPDLIDRAGPRLLQGVQAVCVGLA